MNTTVSSLRDAAMKVTAVKGWQPARASSSAPASIAVSALPGAAVGSLSLTVDRLATAAAAVSTGSVSSRETPVASGPLVMSRGLPALGLGTLTDAGGLEAGAHTVSVTQSSAPAVAVGATPLGALTQISAGAGQLELEVDGAAVTLQLAAGDYTPDDLVAEVNRASGGTVRADLDARGALRLSSIDEGSDATLRVLTDAPAVGLVAGAAHVGTDAHVRLDGDEATEQVLTSVVAGQRLTLTDSSGATLHTTVTGGLRTGEATVHKVGVPSGATLAQVGDALNSARAGVTAAVVQVSATAFRLQLTSTSTGTASTFSLDTSTLAGLGPLQSVQDGRDAVLTVGSGAGAYQVTRSSNTVSGLLAGVTLTLVKADPATTVTLDVARDTAALTSQVGGIVTALNSALTQLSDLTRYDPATKKAGLLMGDSMVRRMSADLLGVVTSGTSVGGLTASQAGITVGRNGQLVFDQAAFAKAYDDDPVAVEALLGRGTEARPGLAGRAEALATRLTRAGDGQIPTSIRDRENEIKGYDSRISSWDSRLTVREAALRRQFSSLETSLGSLQQQSSWLAGQLSSLSSGGKS